MRTGRQTRGRVSGLGLRAGGQLLAGLLVFWSAALVSAALAQEGWAPTISSTAGLEVTQRLMGPKLLPQWNTAQRFSPPPALRVPPKLPPDPQERWTPIETGALPSTDLEVIRERISGTEAPLVNEGEAFTAVATADQATPAAAQSEGPQKTPERAVAPQPRATEAAKTPAQRAPTGPAQPAAAAASPSVKPETAATTEAVAAPEAPQQFGKARPLDALPPDATAAQQYCFNTAESASDARVAWQAKKIKDMEAALEARMVVLQQKTEEYKTWLAKRDDFARKAHEKLVAFYAKMKPDAAALQLSAMDEDQAAALLMKLEPKAASLVLAEIEPERAAKIASIISGAARIPKKKTKDAQVVPPVPADTPAAAGAGAPPVSAPEAAKGSNS